MSLYDELSELSGNEWNNLFQMAIDEGKKQFNSMPSDVTYQYLGELDSPMDCIEKGVPKEIVKNQFHGKCNVFSVSNGTYVFCSDFQAEAIFESGKCISRFECDWDEDEDKY
jgi:hypothetical protein